MRFTKDGQEYRIFFNHFNPELDPVGGTNCSIESANPEDESYECYRGFAQLHPQDNFSKEKGRKIALARALQTAGWLEADRRYVWLAYFSRSPKNEAIVEQIRNKIHWEVAALGNRLVN